VSDLVRYRLDDVRRHATELANGVGLAPVRAAALASHLLWFDAAGASTFGIATLPRWLERIEAREFDVAAEGKVLTERNGTAVLDGQAGVPPLLLERAAILAVEKARDAGVGLVRVVHIGPTGPAAALAAEIAIGPFWAWIMGPGPSFALALPSDQGLPAVYDPALAPGAVGAPGKARPARPSWAGLDGLAPWAGVLATEGGWLIAALAVAAWEPLPKFHDRVHAVLRDHHDPGPGQLLPDAWEAHRRDVRERGVPLPAAVRKDLARWAERLGVTPVDPEPR
jgi:LDH2 family malate/lactate/ureidoglycolate dehydrogenase